MPARTAALARAAALERSEGPRDRPLTLRGREDFLDVLPAIWDVASPSLAELFADDHGLAPGEDEALEALSPADAASLLGEWDDHLFALGLAPLRRLWLYAADRLRFDPPDRVFLLDGDELAALDRDPRALGERRSLEALLDERAREWETARARLTAIESRLSDRLIKAPFSGVVGLRNISVGALVEPGDLITTLDDDSVMKLDLAVPSLFVPSLVIGMPVDAVTRAYGERAFDGRLHSIDSRIDTVTRSIKVRVILPNPERLLKPGMLMQVTLRKDARRTLVLPEAALMPQGREQFVMVAVPVGQGHKVERRQVTIGSRRPGEVEVLQGVQAGELVVTHGTMRVRPGQAVSVRAIGDGSESLAELLKSPPAVQEAEPAK